MGNVQMAKTKNLCSEFVAPLGSPGATKSLKEFVYFL